MLSFEGWINGLTTTGILVFGCILGSLIFYKSIKLNAKILSYMGLTLFGAGLMYLGNSLDFLTILLTEKNMDNSYGLVSILGWMWVPFVSFFLLYVGGELLLPKKKKYIIALLLIVAVIFELSLFFDPTGSIISINPETPGENLIDDNPNLKSPPGIIVLIIMILTISCGFGFLIKSFRSKGVIKKKNILFSVGILTFAVCVSIENFITISIIVLLLRIGQFVSLFIFYLSLKEEPAETKKLKPKKEIKIEQSLFRLSQKPAQITEEEVSISKEKKICLVCKGKVLKYIYICSECETFYCLKCAQAMSELENLCWVCNTPIDDSKPSKPDKKTMEDFDIKIPEKTEKKL